MKMNLSYSLKFAKSLIFPKAEKKSIARKSLFGAVLCIGLSIVPLVVVTSVTNGMIDGMTERIIGLSTSHIQAYVAPNISKVKTVEAFTKYTSEAAGVRGVVAAYPEVEISALAAGKNGRSGIEIRAIEPDIFVRNKSFAKLFEVCEGELGDFISAGGEKLAIIGQKLSDPAPAAILMSLEAVFSALFGTLILHQMMSGREILGSCIMFAAVILVQLSTLKE